MGVVINQKASLSVSAPGPLSGTVVAGQTQPFLVPEGFSLSVKSLTGVGQVTVVDQTKGENVSQQAWAIAAGTSFNTPAMSGTQQVVVTCTAGSLDAAVESAVIGVDQLAAQMIFSQSQPSGTKNKAVFATAVAANAVKMAYVGHSIVNGNNQNFYGATVYRLIKRALKAAFPSVAFTFANFGIGGSIASQFLGTSPATAIAAMNNSNVYRENWEGFSLAASQPSGAWRTVVAGYQPDIIFFQWDLNETNVTAFANAMRAIIDDIANNAAWSAKRPSIVLLTSHTGVGNGGATTTIVRQCHKVLRALAKANGVALLDAGRLYDIYTTGADPVNILPYVTGEIALGYPVPVSTLLDPLKYESKIGSATRTSGTTVRDAGGGVNFRAYRNRLCPDGAIEVLAAAGQATSVLSLFYRADPNDANYATGTGTQYELRLSGTTAQVYFWSGGTATAITGSSVTLATAVVSNATYQMRAEVIGAEHQFTIVQPNGAILTKEFVDDQYLGAGYLGFGYGVTSGVLTGSFFNIGTPGNVSTGFVLEFWDYAAGGKPKYAPSQLLGNDSSSVWNASYGTDGGNAVNHLTNFGHKLIYEPLVGALMRSLQIS